MAWPLPDFPAGVGWFKAYLQPKDSAGKPESGTLYIQPETPMVHTATGWYKSNSRVGIRAQQGEVQAYLPWSDQTGFTDGAGGVAVVNPAYLFEWVPYRSGVISTRRFVAVNGSDYGNVNGATVLIANLMDIGAWPHAPIKIYPPSSGGGVAGTYVETPAGSGLWRES